MTYGLCDSGLRCASADRQPTTWWLCANMGCRCECMNVFELEIRRTLIDRAQRSHREQTRTTTTKMTFRWWTFGSNTSWRDICALLVPFHFIFAIQKQKFDFWIHFMCMNQRPTVNVWSGLSCRYNRHCFQQDFESIIAITVVNCLRALEPMQNISDLYCRR